MRGRAREVKNGSYRECEADARRGNFAVASVAAETHMSNIRV
jgi:hypothetical protein